MDNKLQIKKDSSGEESEEIILQKNSVVKQTADIDGFLTKRKEFIDKVSAICVEGKDFHIIQGKKSLAKGGAEKIASIFHWTAKFDKDTESLEMLGDIKGLVTFKCTLVNGEFVGEGRGAATLAKNGGDPNKTLKMAQKSAFIDAVLRASGLSDFFTQDLEDMPSNSLSTPYKANFAPSEKQIDLINSQMLEKGVTEEDLLADGFPALKDLTGGKDGTASELITHLFKVSKFSNGFRPLDEQDKIVHQFTVDLEACTTPAMYEKVASEIKIAKDNGHLTDNSYAMLLKTCKVIVAKIQEAGLKPKSHAAELMERGINQVTDEWK